MSGRRSDPPHHLEPPTVPTRLIDGIWHCGTQPTVLCSWCELVQYDPAEFSGCPGCKAWNAARERERLRLEARVRAQLTAETLALLDEHPIFH